MPKPEICNWCFGLGYAVATVLGHTDDPDFTDPDGTQYQIQACNNCEHWSDDDAKSEAKAAGFTSPKRWHEFVDRTHKSLDGLVEFVRY
jgi:hypothetical protein